MKVYKYLSILILACAFYTGNVLAQTEQQEPTLSEEEVKAELKKSGFSDKDVEIMYKELKSGGINLCNVCYSVEKLLGDPDTTCGGNTWQALCLTYMGSKLKTYVQSHCPTVVANQAKICALGSSSLNTVIKLVCSDFSCPSTTGN